MLYAETILAAPNPYLVVTNYVNEFQDPLGNQGVEQLTKGLQITLLMLDLDSEYHNGGLLQYFGNRTEDRAIDQATVRVQKALRQMGASDMADLVAEASEHWETLVKKYPHPDESCFLMSEARPAFILFDERFQLLYEQTVIKFNEYIHSHVDDFCSDV